MSPSDGISQERDPSGFSIETPRLVLRQPVRADAERLAELANERMVAENLGTLPHPYDIDDALSFIDNTEVGPQRWSLGIYEKTANGSRLVGTIGLMPRDGERFGLGYWVGLPHWGAGFATEAAQAVVDYAFAMLGAEAISATARVTNGASRRVLEKSGFQYAGQGMGPSLFFRGMVPIDRFRLERSIWMSLKNWAHSDYAARRLATTA